MNVQLNILIHLLSCPVSFWMICCEHSLYNLQKLTDSFHRLLTNWVPQFKTIVIKKLMSSVETLYKCLSHSFCSHILAQFKYYLLRQFIIIRRFIQPSLDNRSTTKLMNIFHQICFDTGRGFKKALSAVFSAVVCMRFVTFWQNVQTFCSILSQKNCLLRSDLRCLKY
jgi:hypothetical protein